MLQDPHGTAVIDDAIELRGRWCRPVNMHRAALNAVRR